VPVTEQAGALPHRSGGIRETNQKENKEEGSFSASRWESQVRRDSELALSWVTHIPRAKRGFVHERGKEAAASSQGTREMKVSLDVTGVKQARVNLQVMWKCPKREGGSLGII